ncbi:hypothetical protein EK21DRAFT_103708 [Setomelanomma holmii]|uniref:Uncharacterized protein n=1 Tax=Setomelanomma holmii TaxID=210430 RepID=A0A9P4H287_9PLEO|nr:hypothetical protein EK21DRAFT_103708 [Setomelanomma holmii]
MPTRIHLHDYEIRDATPKGKEQCRALSSVFQYHNDDVPFVLHPALQEVGDMGSDRGIVNSGEEVKGLLPELFAGDKLEFDLGKIDASGVMEGWISDQGYWGYEKKAISKRVSDFRNWLFQRPEAQVVVDTHGAVAHFLTEYWDVEDPMIGTAYKNCEHREFVFTPQSTAEDAHVVETAESRARRGLGEPESDPHVLEEMKKMQAEASGGHAQC